MEYEEEQNRHVETWGKHATRFFSGSVILFMICFMISWISMFFWLSALNNQVELFVEGQTATVQSHDLFMRSVTSILQHIDRRLKA